ncbi:hypothetical protein HER39_14535 [Arthrobacter deserti]|uniref:Uncharacterized protein n=1 Tax=Arthrobacter deserti TaxID=1742687 RepID=A0ABX1JR42_9MICC|nr:hypothetical protein [Arthrobacter deserti]
MEKEPEKKPEPGQQEGGPAGGAAAPPVEEQNPVDTDNPDDNPPLPRVWN